MVKQIKDHPVQCEECKRYTRKIFKRDGKYLCWNCYSKHKGGNKK